MSFSTDQDCFQTGNKMAAAKERKKVAQLLEKEAEIQKLWEDNKAFEANASTT